MTGLNLIWNPPEGALVKRRGEQSFVVNVESTQQFEPYCHLREMISSCLEWNWMPCLKSNWEWIFGRERSGPNFRRFSWNQDQ